MRSLLKLIFLLIFLSLAFLPQIASSPFGKPFFIHLLEKKTRCKIEIEKLKLSWFGPQVFQNIQWSRNNVQGNIQEFEIHAPFWSFSGPFKLKSSDFVLAGRTLQGYVSLKGQIYSKLHFHILIDVKQFPLIALNPTLEQLLGPTLDLSGEVSLNQDQGTIDLVVSSQNLKTTLKGILTPHSITLQEPLTANLRLTSEMSRLLLKSANPLFITGIEAQNPVTLRIEPKGFYFPLPFSLEKLSIGSAILNLGKVRCQNGKSLQTILLILKKAQLSNVKIMDAWFTPVSLSLQNGVLHAGRMDALLAHSIHICTWGRVDLVKDKMEMILGIPADTLESSFGVQKLDPDYVLKIPIQGSTKDPEINAKSAMAKIAALMVAPNKGIFGAIKDLFSKKEKDVPPPQKPFPWEL